mmetsp:Transcript_70127/g.196509  ORF Transcript_70127/g.196509 Transcript_70127/m.196509 type:complete len:335 (+) Transcript_70127:476-1480(+)
MVRHHVAATMEDQRRHIELWDLAPHPVARAESELVRSRQSRLHRVSEILVVRRPLQDVLLHIGILKQEVPDLLVRRKGPRWPARDHDVLEDLKDGGTRKQLAGHEQHGTDHDRAIQECAITRQHGEQHPAAHRLPHPEDPRARPPGRDQRLHVRDDNLLRCIHEAVPIRDVDEAAVAAPMAWKVKGNCGERAHVAQGLGLQTDEKIGMITEAVDEQEDGLHLAFERRPSLIEHVLAALQRDEAALVVQLLGHGDLVQDISREILLRNLDGGRGQLSATLSCLPVGDHGEDASPHRRGQPRSRRSASGPNARYGGEQALGRHLRSGGARVERRFI